MSVKEVRGDFFQILAKNLLNLYRAKTVKIESNLRLQAESVCELFLANPFTATIISTLVLFLISFIVIYSLMINTCVAFLLLNLLLLQGFMVLIITLIVFGVIFVMFFVAFLLMLFTAGALRLNTQIIQRLEFAKAELDTWVPRVPVIEHPTLCCVPLLPKVCNSEEVPEVEIVSLLQEHIPKYRLRADSLTQFGGYENQDWFIPSPALQVGPDDLALTPDQIRETLNYFLLCSNRVSQMTKTYNDIEAVTRLLEEKEKDLELTARIGKELLAANGRLEARVSALEGELRAARDLVTQLKHDLHAKADLLQVLTNDTEEGAESPEEREEACAAALRRRTGALERENRALRDEAARLAEGADSAELAERQLLRDIAHQLSSANSEAHVLGVELAHERERAADLQHQLDTATARLTATERNLHQLTAEHEHTLRILEITKENQNALAVELADTKDRYAEIAAHLAEAQEQLRAVRKRAEPVRGLMPSVAAAAGLLPSSLYREMHSSMYSDLSLDSGISDPLAHSSMQKVFETVQCASRWSGSLVGSDAVDAARAPCLRPRSHDSLVDDASEADSEELYPGGTMSGVPGAPGAAELAAALRRLSPADIDSRRASLVASHATMYRRNTDRDSSAESAVWGAGCGAGAGAGVRWRGPHKLQIVKPLEGSLTLHTWAQLAKPTMSGLLEEQEGVGVRGARTAAALGLRTYHLSDVEEDDDMLRFPHSSHVYTITNSTVLHPNDGSMGGSVCSSGTSSLASSVLGSAWSSRRTSRRSSAAGSPTLSRRDSFATPAAPPPPPRIHFTPTATPANSPLLGASPDSSPPSTPVPGEGGAPSLHALIASGASMLRRTFLSSPASDTSSPAPLALQTPGSLYTGLVHRSPMEQLTCLKRTLRSPAGSSATDKIGVEIPLGVPAQPGSGALDASGAAGVSGAGAARRGRGPRAPRPRTDLGTVGSASTNSPSAHSSPLGTLSSLLFGRKGGLL